MGLWDWRKQIKMTISELELTDTPIVNSILISMILKISNVRSKLDLWVFLTARGCNQWLTRGESEKGQRPRKNILDLAKNFPEIQICD